MIYKLPKMTITSLIYCSIPKTSEISFKHRIHEKLLAKLAFLKKKKSTKTIKKDEKGKILYKEQIVSQRVHPTSMNALLSKDQTTHTSRTSQK